ncbi:hypothetical protein IAT40_004375 [Kwoniella sp. CBS 6097]
MASGSKLLASPFFFVMAFILLLLSPVLSSPVDLKDRKIDHVDHSPGPTHTSANNRHPPQITLHPANQPDDCEKDIVITGLYDENFHQDLYLGIPYAQPPTGPLRFRPPQNISYDQNFNAQAHPPACLQAPNTTSIGYHGSSEDCLYLNVFTPHRSKRAQHKLLPVVVYVHGGSFIQGTASIYNGSWLVQHSQKMEESIIYVAINFRLGIFGWGYGCGFAENGAANLGLRDTRQALKWVQQNIRAFGGHPSKVTVLGGSSGSVGISLLYLDSTIDTFRSAIMSSGSQSTAPTGATATTWEDSYQYLLNITSCISPEQTENSFECLRILPPGDLLAAQSALQADPRWAASFIFAPSIDGDLIPASPRSLLEAGRYARIPFIAGNVKDEGTEFIPPSITASSVYQVIAAIEPIDPSPEIVAQVAEAYPDVPALGSPYGTGNKTFGLDSAFKQASSIFGDLVFQTPRRYFIRQANSDGLVDTWTYQFEQISPDRPAYIGVSHATDVPYFFGEARPGVGSEHYQQFNYTDEDWALSDRMMDYWINFIHHTNPNGTSHHHHHHHHANLPEWPRYHSRSKRHNMLRLKAEDIEVIQDTYREEAMEVFSSNPQQFNYKRKRSLEGSVHLNSRSHAQEGRQSYTVRV